MVMESCLSGRKELVANQSGLTTSAGSNPALSARGIKYRMKKYFIVDRYRQYIDSDYVKEFLSKKKETKFYTSLEKAKTALHKGFYDDSDYGIFSMDEKSNIERHS